MRCKTRTPQTAIAIFIFVLALSLRSAAQVSSYPGTRQSQSIRNLPKYPVSGIVLNSATGDPIFRALVQVGTNTTFSDHEGRFKFAAVQQMSAAIGARKPGFFSEQELSQRRRNQRPVQIGPEMQPVTIKLVPEGVIAGRVVNEQGEPLEGIKITATDPRVVNGRKTWQISARVSTNDLGEFRIAGLKPGSYFISTAAKGQPIEMLPEVFQDNNGYPPVYYPGTTEVASATPLQIIPGKTVLIDLILKPGPFFVVSGTVRGLLPDRFANIEFTNGSNEDPSFGLRFDVHSGKFRAFVLPGVCTIKARGQDAPDAAVYAETTLNVIANVSDVSLQLLPLNSIPINVRMRTNKPADRYTPIPSFGMRREPNISVTIRSQDRSHPDGFASMSEGSPPFFALRNLHPGKFVVEAVPSSSALYVESIFRGAADLSRDELSIVVNESEAIEVSVRDDGATLTGKVQDSGTDTEATILLVPQRSPLQIKTVSTNSEGAFQQSALAPGDYKVFAFENVDDLEYTNPEALLQYSAEAAFISLQADQKAMVKLNVIRRKE
jgi:hypothetical protein